MKMPITSKWDELSNPKVNLRCEELVLRNTFVKAQMGPLADLKFGPDIEHQPRAVKWVDNNENDKTKLVTNKSEDDLVYKENVDVVNVHRDKSQGKSNIKPYNLNMVEVTGVPKLNSCKSS